MNEQTVVYFVLFLVIQGVSHLLEITPNPPVSRRYVIATVLFAAVGSWVLGHRDIEPPLTLGYILVSNIVIAVLPALFVKGADDTGYWTWPRLGGDAAFYYATLVALSLVPRVCP